MAVKDNWNWSRSNLFFGLPFYHAGLKATYELSKAWTAELMICNGWNNIVDNNRQKSVEASATYKPTDRLTLHFLYFGGVERPTGAPEGEPWRHLFDAWATWDATNTLSFILNADAGFETNNFGTSDWTAIAGYIRIRLSKRFFLAARADVFREHAASNPNGTASSLFWPGDRVASETLTLDFRPMDNISIRLEGRHDSGSTECTSETELPETGARVPLRSQRPVADHAHPGSDYLVLGRRSRRQETYRSGPDRDAQAAQISVGRAAGIPARLAGPATADSRHPTAPKSCTCTSPRRTAGGR